MQICVMVEGQEGVTWSEWVAIARAVEANGCHGLFRSDHYTSFHGPAGPALDAWATLAGLAAHTERIRLGTLVSPATFRHPSELARVAVTADHASGGRIDVGIGAGWFEDEHRQNGFPFPSIQDRYDRLAEYAEVLVRSWSGERFDFQGRHFSLAGQRALPVPVQVPHPPLIVGGRGKSRSLALAARYGQEYNTSFSSPDDCGALRARLDVACTALGRDSSTLPLSLMWLVALGHSHEDAQRRLSRALERFRGPRERCFAGTLDEAAEVLGHYAAAGVQRVYLQHPDRSDFAALELLGELAALAA